MAMIVVSGGGKDVGKTSLVCGLIAALPEFAWAAVKITNHAHGKAEPVWEETTPGAETDTARYLAAGARRAFLITAEEVELPQRIEELQARLEVGAHLIFESNRVLRHVRPDVILTVEGALDDAHKPSFREAAHQTTARVAASKRNATVAGATPLFQLAALERISTGMRRWLREQLAGS